jgi:hypothetical protein
MTWRGGGEDSDGQDRMENEPMGEVGLGEEPVVFLPGCWRRS